MKRLIIFASLSISAGLMLTNIYTSIVDATSWGSNMPASIETARAYYQTTNPGDFFRIFSPVNQVLALLCVFMFWKRSTIVRWYLVAAFIMYFIAEGLTFMYFYPRNDIMFVKPITDWKLVQSAWQEWTSMNWVRTLLLVVGIVCSSLALHKTYQVADRRVSNRKIKTLEKEAVAV